jgi:hypothetical protein
VFIAAAFVLCVALRDGVLFQHGCFVSLSCNRLVALSATTLRTPYPARPRLVCLGIGTAYGIDGSLQTGTPQGILITWCCFVLPVLLVFLGLSLAQRGYMGTRSKKWPHRTREMPRVRAHRL